MEANQNGPGTGCAVTVVGRILREAIMMLLQTVRHRSQLRLSFGVFVLVLSLATSAGAQSAGTGSIGGTARDPNGLVVPGVEVTIRNPDTGAERKLTTNEAGLYAAPFLQPGRYEVRGQKAGFASVVRTDLRLEVGQALTVDIDLPLKAEQQTVTVTGEAGLVETTKFDVSQRVTQVQVENLPLNGRRWDNLVLLTPGVSEDGGFGGVSFRGISSLYNNNMVDGADNNQAFFAEARGRTRLPYGYSLDAIKEFNVTTAVYSAEFGRAAGGVVNAVTKSGTNEMHGDLFYFIRDQSFLAGDPIANASGQPKPEERRQQFGGSFGGPIVKEKLFFFLDYDQQKHNFPAVIIPASANFFSTTDAQGEVFRCTDVNCPTVIAALSSITNTTNPRNGDNYIGLSKVDYQVNPNNRISSVFNILRWNSPDGIFTSPTPTTTALGNGTDLVNNEFVTTTWNSVISSALVNELRFQYGRDFEAQIPNASGPSISITGAASFGMPNFLPRGAFPNEKRFQWVDNLSWVRGRHEIKTGLDINYVRDNIQNLFQGGGVYSYTDTGATGPGGALNKFVQDLRSGSRTYFSFTQAVDPITGSGTGFFTTTDYDFYVQDNLKVRTNLTLNLGVRYELQTMPSVVKANPAVPETASLNTDTNNFGPRVGFAWSLGKGQKQVIRGGYGIYYGRTQNSSVFTALFQNGVFQQTFRLGTTDCGAPTVPNVLFPQPSTAPAFTPIFGGSGPTPTNTFPSLAAFLAACPTAVSQGSVVDALDPTFVNPLVHEFDLAYEHELPWNVSASLSYVGARGNRLPVFVDANLPQPDMTQTYVVSGSLFPSQQFTVPFFSGAVPRPRTGVGVLLMGKSVINSWYNGLVIRVRRPPTRGFSFDANFTWSQARDNGQVAGVNGTFAGTVSALNPFDLRGEYGLSEIDIRRRFILNLYWETPFANWTQNEVLKHIVGGWKVASVWRVQDGRPVEADSGRRTCTNGDGGLTCGAVNGNGAAVNGRAPFIERNTLFTSPGLFTTDLRVGRAFKIKERSNIEFLWEAFNLFNRTNAVPSSGINAVDNVAFNFTNPGGACTAPPGVTNFGGCLTQRSGFLTVRSTGNTLFTARQMQLGVKFRF